MSGARGTRLAMVLVLLVSVMLPAGAAAAQERAALPDIEDEVMCTICGTLLEESQSPQAERERALIRRLIARGEDKQQIKNALVDQYGPQVLATPSGHGFDLLAWLVPGGAIVLALIGIVVALIRARRRTAPQDSPELDSSDLARLERDMSSYDV